MKRFVLAVVKVLCFIPVTPLMLLSAAASQPASPPKTVAGLDSLAPAPTLRMEMRSLWEQDAACARNYIISSLGGLADSDEVAQRWLDQQDEIGKAIKPYYGEETGAELSTLLRERILIATEMMRAAEARDGARLIVSQKDWSAKGREIASLLASANPNWPKAVLEEMFQTHMDLTTRAVVARLNKDWADDTRSYRDGHAHALLIADTLADGIVAQFSSRLPSTDPR